MTGGKAYLYRADSTLINHDYLTAVEMTPSDEQDLYALLSEYLTDTQSRTAALLLENWHREKAHITKYLPIALAKAMATASAQAESLA
jgi:glutamate synthase domain-containing protein 3